MDYKAGDLFQEFQGVEVILVESMMALEEELDAMGLEVEYVIKADIDRNEQAGKALAAGRVPVFLRDSVLSDDQKVQLQSHMALESTGDDDAGGIEDVEKVVHLKWLMGTLGMMEVQEKKELVDFVQGDHGMADPLRGYLNQKLGEEEMAAGLRVLVEEILKS